MGQGGQTVGHETAIEQVPRIDAAPGSLRLSAELDHASALLKQGSATTGKADAPPGGSGYSQDGCLVLFAFDKGRAIRPHPKPIVGLHPHLGSPI